MIDLCAGPAAAGVRSGHQFKGEIASWGSIAASDAIG
jgi:hypothetical protein